MNRLEILKEKYGFHKGSYKYVLPGAEILRYVGQVVVHVHFTKSTVEGSDEEEWTNTIEKVQLLSIDDFDPMTMTYNCKYLVGDENPETKELRIIPEGFSWGNPEETKEMDRFLPYSLHCTMVEEEAIYYRVGELYNTRETMKLEFLENITKSKDQAALLKYANNIGAAVKLEDGTYLWIRAHSLSLRHKNGTKYALKFANNDRSWSLMIDSTEQEYDFEGLGKMKILDLV